MKNIAIKEVLGQTKKTKRAFTFPLANYKANLAWTFGHLTPKETSYVSHGYHRYPAKFIPQLAHKIIKNYSSKDSIVGDPFMGSGTTILEALLLGRRTIGTDINPVAVLISQAKLRPLNPDYLQAKIGTILQNMKLQVDEEIDQQLPLTKNGNFVSYEVPTHELQEKIPALKNK